MGGILSAIFGSDEPETPSFQATNTDYTFQEDTTKLVGVPLTVVYGDRVHVKGNVVHRKLSSNRKNIQQAVALCWGPVNFDLNSIRINEKRPEYINDVLNANRDLDPGYISGVKVWTHNGHFDQAPAHGLEYGMNRTAYLWCEAVANSDLSSITQVEIDAYRGKLFVPGSGYNTPIPAPLAAAFPTGISSGNPIAAGLDYMLNTDYGAGRDPAMLGNMETWIDAISRSNETINISDASEFAWAKFSNTVASETTLTKNAASGDGTWNAGASSASPVSLDGGWVEFTAVSVNDIVCGLSSSPGHIVADMDFGFLLGSDGQAYVVEHGSTEPSAVAGYTTGTTFLVDVDPDGLVTYWVNNSKLFTATHRCLNPSFADVGIKNNGASIKVSDWVSGPESEPRFCISLEAGGDDGDMHADVLQKILDVANSTPFDANGVTKLWFPRKREVAAYLDMSNFIPQSASTVDIMDVPNVVSVEYKSSDANGDKREVVWEDEESIKSWREIRSDNQMFGINSRTQASRMARFRGRRAKSERLKIKGIADQQFFNLEPGDLVALTYGSTDSIWFTNKLFWIDTIVPDNKDGDVELQLVEFGGDDLFDDGMANTYDSSDPLTVTDPSLRLPNPSQHPELATGVVATIGVQDRRPTKLFFIDVTWTIPLQPDYMHQDWVIYRRSSEDEIWQAINSVSGHATGYRDIMVEPHTTNYFYAVAARTSNGVESILPITGGAFVESMSLDKPGAPSDVAIAILTDRRAEVRWDYSNEPIDFEGFMVYAVRGNTWDMDTAVNISKGMLTAKFLRTDDLSAPGRWTVAVFSKDTFGNLSEPAILHWDMPMPEDPTGLVAVASTNGIQLSWNPASNTYAIKYEIRDGESWDSGQVINAGFSGTSIFVPLFDASRHNFMLRTVDFFGNYGAAVLSVSAAVLRPNNVLASDATAQGDNVRFTWTQVVGPNIEYEIRIGESWSTGNFVARVGGDNYTTLLPHTGDLVFWIKAVSSIGLYSTDPFCTTTRRAATSNRNVVISRDMATLGWAGVKYNMEVVGETLAVTMNGSVPASHGEFYFTVDLEQPYHARNWVDYSVRSIATDFANWKDSNFAWNSEEAAAPWFPTGDADGVTVIARVAVEQPLDANVIDGWTFDGSIDGLRGTNPSVNSGVTYGTGRFADGLKVSDCTHVSYDVAIPAEFSVTFDIRFDTMVSGYLTLASIIGATGSLGLYYDSDNSELILADDLGNKVVISIHLDLGDLATFCISQSATTRSLRVKKATEGMIHSADGAFAPVGSFTTYRLY